MAKTRSVLPRLRTKTWLPTVSALTFNKFELWFRFQLPIRGLERAGLARAGTMCTWKDLPPRFVPEEVVLIDVAANESFRLDAQAAIDGWHEQGSLIVVDTDDDDFGLTISDWTYSGMELPAYVAEATKPSDPLFVGLDRMLDAFVRQLWNDRHDASPELLEELAARIQISYTARIATLVWSSHSLKEALARARPFSHRRRYEGLLRSADLLTVSTPPLAKRYGAFNPHVVILPNPVDLTLECFRQRQRPHTGVILGWAGTETHLDDIKAAAPAVKTLMQEYDGQDGRPLLRLMLGGDHRIWLSAFADLPGAQPFLDAILETQRGKRERFSTGLISPCGRYIYRSWESSQQRAPAMYRDVDIGLVPLKLDTAINRSKSDLKGLDMAAMGVPCVASPIPAYVEWRGRPGTGAVVLETNETREWLAALRPLIEDETHRRRMAAEARAFAETRSLDRWAPRWMDAYRDAAERRGLAWAQGGEAAWPA